MTPWKLSDGREVPAVIDHDYAQRELLHAQTPGVGRKPYKRGLADAAQANKAIETWERRQAEFDARMYESGGIPLGSDAEITVTPRGPVCAALFQRYEAGELTREELVAQWGVAWDADQEGRR